MNKLRSGGLFITQQVGAIVYYATVIPWEFPNFSVSECLPRLQQLGQLIETQGSISTFEDRFMIVARKVI